MIDWIYGTDPYTDFPAADFPMDLHGWGANSPIFAHVIESLPADALVIEVGTWKGASAINMAKQLAAAGKGGRIICVDTWLGSPELHTTDLNFGNINEKHGRPRLYEQFLANVIHSGQQTRIIPFPANSLTAAQVLRAKGVIADAIYIDAAHDYDHVRADLAAWWPVVRSGGIFCGDDYLRPEWPGVERAVREFAHGLCEINLQFTGKWLIRKPKEKQNVATLQRQLLRFRHMLLHLGELRGFRVVSSRRPTP